MIDKNNRLEVNGKNKFSVLIKFLHLSSLLTALLVSLCFTVKAQQNTPNIVIFLVDDLRVDLGTYGSEHVISPNIDDLAKQGVKFTHAYAQQAICGPSRVSIMTGLRPETTGLYSIDRAGRLRPNQPNVVSMPQLFKENGYQTISIGKVYHSVTDDQENWTTHIKKLDNFYAIAGNKEKKFAYEAGDVADDFYKDGKVANDAIATLKNVKNDKFLMVVGFSKPHLPFNAPKKYWDLYDRKQFTVPSRKKPDNMYRLALTKWNELRMYGGIPKEGDTDDELTKTLIHAYYASVSYMDAQVGKVMQALDDLQLRDNTMIVFMSDHGYKLGEYGAWNKHTNMELDTRVPLIISRETAHKNRVAGATSAALIENIDIFPTIAEAAGLPLPNLDGKSLLTLLDQPNMAWDNAAYSLFTRGKKRMGVSVTDGIWRYTEWRNADSQAIEFTELYFHKDSLVAVENVAGQKHVNLIQQRLKTLLDTNFPSHSPPFHNKPKLDNNSASTTPNKN
ncbi:sulfatase [Aliiglaciecola sp. 3_MG-2023]|uniref:sulfatase n=1 Tax=Aliiglaciecola sp. 3_MG-2023 TaxID=3062644 RepID=UPI0026E1938B|nr:sulfatase [Aliiglaciecola sp. 3_MG-2023]MDO6693304.1 sulfatase [Aliiglaciecola sp. 3_MG-2023]